MQDSGNSWFAGGAAALIGLLTCLGLTIVTGGDIAWDAKLYYIIGVPIMTFFAYVLGYSFPRAPWRWVVYMAIGQLSSVLFVEDVMVLWWLAAGYLLVASVPQFIAAYVGSNIAWNRARPGTRN